MFGEIPILSHSVENFVLRYTILFSVPKILWRESQFCLTVPKILWSELQFCLTVLKMLRGESQFVSQCPKYCDVRWITIVSHSALNFEVNNIFVSVEYFVRWILFLSNSAENFVVSPLCLLFFFNLAGVFLFRVIFCEYFQLWYFISIPPMF